MEVVLDYGSNRFGIPRAAAKIDSPRPRGYGILIVWDKAVWGNCWR